MIQTKIDNQQDIKDGSKCVVILEDRDFKLDNKTTHWDKVLICGKHTSDDMVVMVLNGQVIKLDVIQI